MLAMIGQHIWDRGRCLVVLSLLFSWALTLGATFREPALDLKELRAAYEPRLERNLKDNIVRFWMSKGLDRRHGGFIINFGPRGEAKGDGTKMIVTQARMVWLFSRLARTEP